MGLHDGKLNIAGITKHVSAPTCQAGGRLVELSLGYFFTRRQRQTIFVPNQLITSLFIGGEVD